MRQLRRRVEPLRVEVASPTGRGVFTSAWFLSRTTLATGALAGLIALFDDQHVLLDISDPSQNSVATQILQAVRAG